MAGWKKIAAVAGLGLGLSGCASDPEFWDNLAYGLDTLAYELENQPVCSWYTDAYGMARQYCEPAWMANQPVYVAPVYVPPVYTPPPRAHRDRHDRRDRRDHRGRRDDRGHDRDGDRGGRRGRKG
ncbi:hypothetical protein [Brevundimonas viscosa]|uniref:Lipoprotein n=1 Tax=Brevundimonas viscosa TaxID=871741 RepID=A0A1I6SJI2_9CAUL|nr:hypothetical protein [Brevundimonas viscosa]SFS77083.1 hypothetical protein SAMN05192570_2490 [Brevundimonas viscosa]